MKKLVGFRHINQLVTLCLLLPWFAAQSASQTPSPNHLRYKLIDLAGCGKSLNRDDSPPQGLKPSLVLHDLRGPKAPLYHSAAGFRDFFRSLFSREESAGRFTSPPTDPPNHLRSCTKAGNSAALAPSDLRRGNRAFSTARPPAEAS